MAVALKMSSFVDGIASTPDFETAEGGLVRGDKERFADLRAMLTSSKETVKADAMKRIVNMVAKGRDMSTLFADVVMNVACKNVEVKKLVWVYLVRYAEEQQELALLSVSTFQKALKDPNQLIRGSALRVLSSIRVPMIAPIMMLAIRDSVRDRSPYVLKAVAHAIPKLHALDADLERELVECLDILLADKHGLVLGSAVQAFDETCPDRLDLLHRHFRNFCRALADIDEWGQIVMINLLTRYARTYLPVPDAPKADKAGTITMNGGNGQNGKRTESSSDNSEAATTDDDEDDDDDVSSTGTAAPELDKDLVLLLNAARPLLQSRNAGVVMAVVQLFYHCGPATQVSQVARALVRQLRGPRETQYLVLLAIASITDRHMHNGSSAVPSPPPQRPAPELAISKSVFEPFLRSFFVAPTDAVYVRQLKLHILTCLVTPLNVQLVLRELQTYVGWPEAARDAVAAIGRCARRVPVITPQCVDGLLQLVATSRGDETVCCASVLVLRQLLGGDGAPPPVQLLARLARLLRRVDDPTARASLVWLVGRHVQAAGVLAADVLRVIAKTYATEKTLVKLEVLALAAKLWLVDRERCAPLVQYVLQLARFDLSYDVRDRARFVRNLLFNTTRLADQAKLVFLAQKPVAEPDSDFKERSSYQLGTLSHALGQRCERYRDLPAWPEVPSDPALRKRPDSPLPAGANAAQRTGSAPQKDGEFYSDDDEEGEEEEEDEEEETTADDEEDEDEEAEEDEDEEEEDDDDDNEEAEEETSDDEKNSDADEDDDEEEEEDEGNGRAEGAPSKTKKLNTTTLAAV